MQRFTRKPLRTVGGLLVVTATFVCIDSAAAQQVNDEEVVVTARRESESLQTVPVAVNAFSSADIERLDIRRPQDLLQQTPNVLFINAAESGDTQVIIRGINNPRDFDPSYALIVDGVEQPDAYALNRDFVDIEQLEVVKGPVSALYGRNALGGAIVITTRKPSDDYEADAKALYANGEQRQFSGALSGPLGTPTLLARLSVSYNNQNGVEPNRYLGGDVDYYSEKRARARVMWLAAESLTFDLTAEHARIDGNAINFIMQAPFFPAIQPQFTSGVDINNTSVPYGPNVRSSNPATRSDITLSSQWKSDWGQLFVGLTYNKNDNSFGSDYILQFLPVAPFATFEGLSLTGPGANNSLNLIGYSPFPGSIAWQSRNGNDKTVDVRWSSPQDRAVRWSLGAYRARVDRNVFVSVDRDPGNGEIQLVHPNAYTVNVTEDELTTTDVTSGYGQIFWNPRSAIELAAAGRWDKEDRTAYNHLDPRYAALPQLAQYTGLVREDSFRRFQPRVSARWSVTPEQTLYVAYGEGFRSGGFNAPGTRQTVLEVDKLPATVNIYDTYKPQIVKGVDGGLRSIFLDGRLHASLTGFATRSTDTQIFEFTPVTSTRARANIDLSDSYGGEFELQWRTAIPGLSMNAAYGYTRSEIKRNNGNPDSVGNPVPTVPKDTLNVGADETVPMPHNLAVALHLGWQRIGDTPFDINNAPATTRDPVNLLDARLALNGPAWSVALWGRNLGNHHYFNDGVVVTLPGSYPYNKLLLAPYGEPRRFGVEANYHF